MESVLDIADRMQERARTVIVETDVRELWTSIGATVNLIGSLKTGLLINNRDIDFHIYTDPFNLADSFSVMARLAENSRIQSIQYTNKLEAADKCIEWHAFYKDQDGYTWQIDMIHILNESPFSGYFENVADRISEVLTRETREAILRIKNSIPAEQKVMGISIYKAVIQDGIRDVDSFRKWNENQPEPGIVSWIP